MQVDEDETNQVDEGILRVWRPMMSRNCKVTSASHCLSDASHIMHGERLKQWALGNDSE